MTRRSRVMSLWNYFDLPSHELWYFISQKPLFQKFHFKNNSIWWTMQQILRNDFEKWFWEMIYHGTSPMIYHFSKSFLKIWLFMFCLHSLAMLGRPIHSRKADTATLLSHFSQVRLIKNRCLLFDFEHSQRTISVGLPYFLGF